MKRVIVFDAGSLITLSMNCMLGLLEDLKKKFNGKFLITRQVENEIINRPMKIKKYKLEALRLKEMIDKRILEFPESLNIGDNEILSSARTYMKSVNSIFYKNEMPIHLIDLGEASCLALSSFLSKKNIKNLIIIDERTTRMFFEKPENLHNLLEIKLHTKLNHKEFIKEEFKFIRSSELVYLAFKKGFIKNKSPEMLDAMLYATKFKGCAVSNKEIKELESL